MNQFVALLGKSKTNRGVPYSNGTINRYIQWTRAVINYCLEHDQIPENPLKKMRLLKEIPRSRIITVNELEKLIEVVNKYRSYLFPVIMYALQIPTRKSALMHMEKSWVNLEQKVIVIPAKYTKHGRSNDIKPIPDNMMEYFRSIPAESRFVFYKEKDGKLQSLTNHDFDGVWKWCKEKAGISDLHFHDTRHYAATQLLLKGMSERVVMQVGGWKTNMFNTYYNHDQMLAAQMVIDALKTA